MNLAIIPARGGSKRIFRKNIKEFLGKPIIQYSIKAAIESKIFDVVMVSTDDKEVADISIKAGAVVPFFRSEKNSDDFATTSDVIAEVLNEYINMGIYFQRACCIYPTAPFITPEKLQKSYELLKNNKNVDTVIPVVRYSFPPQRSVYIKGGFLFPNFPEIMNKRSQDLEDIYHDTGQFYCFNTNSFLNSKQLFSRKTMPFIISEMEVQDIDTETDWKMAEIKYKLMKGELI